MRNRGMLARLLPCACAEVRSQPALQAIFWPHSHHGGNMQHEVCIHSTTNRGVRYSAVFVDVQKEVLVPAARSRADDMHAAQGCSSCKLFRARTTAFVSDTTLSDASCAGVLINNEEADNTVKPESAAALPVPCQQQPPTVYLPHWSSLKGPTG